MLGVLHSFILLYGNLPWAAKGRLGFDGELSQGSQWVPWLLFSSFIKWGKSPRSDCPFSHHLMLALL